MGGCVCVWVWVCVRVCVTQHMCPLMLFSAHEPNESIALRSMKCGIIKMWPTIAIQFWYQRILRISFELTNVFRVPGRISIAVIWSRFLRFTYFSTMSDHFLTNIGGNQLSRVIALPSLSCHPPTWHFCGRGSKVQHCIAITGKRKRQIN